MTYIDSYSKEDYGLGDNVDLTAFSDFGALPKTDKKYTFLAIDCEKYYSSLTKDGIQATWDWLSETDTKKALEFYHAKDYQFFAGTSFANEKNYYGDVALFNYYQNFDGSIVNTLADSNVAGFEGQLEIFSSLIKNYEGSR